MAKIFNFHEIYDADWFESTLLAIKDRYRIVPVEEVFAMYDGYPVRKNFAHITVDDGHISTYSIVYPLLKKHGLYASIFVSPKIVEERSNFCYLEMKEYDQEKIRDSIARVLGIQKRALTGMFPRSVLKTMTIDQIWKVINDYRQNYRIGPRTPEYMNREQLLVLQDSGFIHIGAHTLNHPILANENDEISRNEIMGSVRWLSDILNRKVTSFAYPNGSPELDFGEREKFFATEAGVTHAFSFAHRDLSLTDDLLSIPRYGLHNASIKHTLRKIRWGTYWEPVKEKFLMTEDKHRKMIQTKLKNR